MLRQHRAAVSLQRAVSTANVTKGQEQEAQTLSRLFHILEMLL